MSIDHLGGKEEVLYLDGETGVGGGVANVTRTNHVDAQPNYVPMDRRDDWERTALRCANRLLKFEELLAHCQGRAGTVSSGVGAVSTKGASITHLCLD